jgi:hypothetical protein
MAIGFNASAGVLYSLTDNISFFGEMNIVNMSYAPTKAELTEATHNGINNLPTMKTIDKKTEFVNNYTESNTTAPLDSQPAKELKQKFPYGSFGLNIGLRISF